MGTGDGLDLGGVLQPSRGRKISFLGDQAARIARSPRTFGNSSHGECAKTRQILLQTQAGVGMSKFFRNSEAVLWAFSISQAVAMLAFNLLLRAAGS